MLVQSIFFTAIYALSAVRDASGCVSPPKRTLTATKPINNGLRPSNSPSGAYDFNMWAKAFKSQLQEFEYEISDIEGSIPSGLSGTLFRNMPARFERAGVDYGHYLDGDGYVTRLTINKGRATFKSRYVRTQEYADEEANDEIRFRSTFRTQRKAKQILNGQVCLSNAFDLKLKNLANTNVALWGEGDKERLVALFEAGVPHRLCPRTLETIGEDDMEIGLKSGMSVLVPSLYELSPSLHDSVFGASMTAHPKVDLSRETFVSWTWRAEVNPSKGPLDTAPKLTVREWDRAMRPISRTEHRLVNTNVAPHDFSITEGYYVFVENRVSGNTLPYILGTRCPAQCVDINPMEPMMLNLVPRPEKKGKKRKEDNDDSMIGREPPSSEYKRNLKVEEDCDALSVPLTPGFTIHSVCAFEIPLEVTTDSEVNSRKEASVGNMSGGGIPGTVELLTTAWDCETVRSGKVEGGLLGSWEGAAPLFDNIPVTLLYRTIVDPKNGRLISHAPVSGMQKTIVEHPHINPLREGKTVRYVFMSMGSTEGISSPPLGYLRLDLLTGARQEWFAPEHTFCEELIVVPKNIGGNENFFKEEDICGSEASEEDSVWLLGTMFDAVREKSCIGVFDGKSVEKGPLATIWLTHHLPHSLHGTFTETVFDSKLF